MTPGQDENHAESLHRGHHWAQSLIRKGLSPARSGAAKVPLSCSALAALCIVCDLSAMEMQRLRRSNFYSESPLDRADNRRQDEAWLAERLAAEDTRFVALWQNRNLVDRLEGDPPRNAVFLDRDHYEALADLLDDGAIFLGEDAEKHSYFAIDLAKLELPDHHPVLAGLGHFADLRLFGPMLPQGEGALLAYARGMIYWHRRHRFCGLCGAPTRSERGGHLRRCTNPACGASHFPRTDPAVIMVVQHLKPRRSSCTHCASWVDEGWHRAFGFAFSGALGPHFCKELHTHCAFPSRCRASITCCGFSKTFKHKSILSGVQHNVHVHVQVNVTSSNCLFAVKP